MQLTLTQRPNSRNWYIRGTAADGRKIFQSTKTDNEAVAKQLLTKANNRLLEESVHGRVATTTFIEAATAYLAAGGESKFIYRETADGEPRGLAVHFGDKLMREITQDDLDKAALTLCPEGSPATLIRNVYTPFIAIWNFAASESRKLVPPRKWERPKRKKGTAVRRAVTRSGTRPVSYPRAFEFVRQMSPATAMVMTALFYTGMRPIELFALLPEEADIDGRWFTLQSTKTGEPRGVPMHEFIVPLIAGLKAMEGPALFLSQKRTPYPLTEDSGGQIKSAINSARRRLHEAGDPINDVSPYTGRHTVSTQLVMNGVHEYIKDQILGHASTDMSRHYTNVPQKPLIDAINTLPVVEGWGELPWMREPAKHINRLVRPVNNGRRGNG